jgi:hypothetical protein
MLPQERPDPPPGVKIERVYRYHDALKTGLIQYYYEDDDGNWIFVKPRPEYERLRGSVLPKR